MTDPAISSKKRGGYGKYALILAGAFLAALFAVYAAKGWTAPTQSPPTENGILVNWLAAKDLNLEASGTAVQAVASSADPRRAPVINGKIRYNSSTVSTTLSGSAGARYIFADLSGSSGFTLANSTASSPGTDRVLVGVAYWDGAAITHAWTVGKAGSYEITVTTTQLLTTSEAYVDAGTAMTVVSDGISQTRFVLHVVALNDYLSASNNSYVGLAVDGNIKDQGVITNWSATDIRFSFVLQWQGLLSAGAHTIKLQHKALAGVQSGIEGHVSPVRLIAYQIGT